MTPAGSMTFLPKIHGPVSTTMKLLPTSYVASSMFPMPPSDASTSKPLRSEPGVMVSRYVHMSAVLTSHHLLSRDPARDTYLCRSPIAYFGDGCRLAAIRSGGPGTAPARPRRRP